MVETRLRTRLLIGVVAAATPAFGAVHEVTVGPGGNIVFDPADIVVQTGDTVRWIWDSNGHNVGYGLPGEGDNSVFFSGPPVDPPNQFEVVFDQAFLANNPVPGSLYDYHCHPHGAFGMVGSITVQPVVVPTVSEWGLLMLTLCLAVGIFRIRYRRPAPVQ